MTLEYNKAPKNLLIWQYLWKNIFEEHTQDPIRGKITCRYFVAIKILGKYISKCAVKSCTVAFSGRSIIVPVRLPG